MKKPRLTIVIPAYNEEANIFVLTKSLLRQNRNNFILDKILVISDGSTDNTVKEVRKNKSNLLEIKLLRKRHGKGYVLNRAFLSLESELVVLVDADVVIKAKDFIVKLIQPLCRDMSIGMVNALAIPLDGVTFTQRAINLTCYAYLEAAQKVHGGNNLYSVSGRAIAYRRQLVQKVRIPVGMIAIDAYTYFCCLRENFKFRLSRGAKVYYRTPRTLKDQIIQNTRFLARTSKMKGYFPVSLVQQESHMPPNIILGPMLKQFIKNPLLCIYILSVNKYCQLKVNLGIADVNGKWEIAQSTKSAHNVN